MSNEIWWYTARSGGIVALVLCAAAVIWGLLLSTKFLQGWPKPSWLLGLHRFLGGAAVVFAGIHVLGLVLDSYVEIGLAEILVPFASSWRPSAVAWGVVAMYILVAVQVSSFMMRRLPRKWWRGIHFSSYLLLWAGLIHGAQAGTDAQNPLYVATMGAIVAVVVFLTGYRILTTARPRGRRQAKPRDA